jgi:glyoxylase-like metal-dependent hydrolase (beta-lactamase superfamily II)
MATPGNGPGSADTDVGGRVHVARAGMDVRAVAMELPGHPGRMSWAYLVEDAAHAVHLIDCGADSARNRAELRAALTTRGRTVHDIASVTATHVHYDHVGMAAWLRREGGARVQLHRRDATAISEQVTYGGPAAASTVERWGVPAARREEVLAAARRPVASGDPVHVDVPLDDGDRLDVPGWNLTVLATPGHTPGHLCVVDAESGTAFVGDHVLPRQHPGPGLGGPTAENPVEEYLHSIERLGGLRLRRLLPGHDRVIDSPAERLAAIRAHHLRRRRHVVELAASSDTVWDIASKVRWSRGWDGLGGVLLFSALAQVESYLTARVQEPIESDREVAS